MQLHQKYSHAAKCWYVNDHVSRRQLAAPGRQLIIASDRLRNELCAYNALSLAQQHPVFSLVWGEKNPPTHTKKIYIFVLHPFPPSFDFLAITTLT